MSKNVGFNLQASIFQLILLVASSGLAHAQTTGFTYQGRLTVDGAAANGNYDLQFALFDSLSGGTQVGSTQTLNTVAVSNGVFTVSLDFGANAFPGATRFLQISARQSGAGGFTLLSPRQPITSTPYAVRSLNAASAETVTINGNQAFRVSGVGSFANSNTFVGVGAGVANTPDAGGVGSSNSFFGKDAGFSNTTGSFNSFFGTGAGRNNSTGTSNSFFGEAAGTSNTLGEGNSFFGSTAGAHNTTGVGNSFFGAAAGRSNSTGGSNSFFGQVAGITNTTGNFNSFFGRCAGCGNTEGSQNSFFGESAGAGNTTGENNSFFGQGAGYNNLTGSLNSFFGQGAGSNNTTANSNSFFGATTGLSNTTGSFNSFFGASAGFSNTTGRNNSFFGVSAGQNNTEGSNNSFFGESTGLRNTTGENNAFFGQTAGLNNTSGLDNSFFGQAAGASNTIGESNSFFGRNAGFTNRSGDFNSFFGRNAGVLNRTGFNNAFFGAFAGGNNDEGFSNSFFGNGAGSNNTSGANNTAIGSGAKFAEGSLLNATAIGANARVDQDSSLVLGGITGVNGGTSVNVGIGTTAPSHRLHVVGNALFTGPLSMGTGTAAAPSMTFSGDTNTGIFSSAADTLNLSTNGISRMQISSSGNVGIGTGAPSARLTVNGMGAFNAAGAARFDLLNPTTGGTSYAQHVTDSGNWQLATVGTNLTRILVNSTGNVGIGTTNPATFRLQVAGSVGPNADNSFNLGSAGLRWGAVFAANGTIQTSDARLKQTIKPLSYGLSELMRLRPVSFRWRDGADARLHLGLLAQDVEKVIPEAVVTGDNAASPLGMNYAELIPVLIKAGQEQQAQIEYQRTQIKEQQQEIESLKRRVEEYDALKALVCADRPDAEVCRSRRGTSGND